MNAPQASAAWQRRQAEILHDTYTQAWKTGQQNYRTEAATPPASANAAAGAPPAQPPAQPMHRALGPAMRSLAQMGAAVAMIVPTAAQITAASSLDAALVTAIKAYLASNAYRLAGGASVAWAGEQHGYVQAAAADGLLLQWQLDAAAHHCDDCPALAGLPPLPLEMWPTLPGDGATQCAAGCKCSMRAVAAPIRAVTALQHEVLSRIGNRQPALVAA